jgi:hypothetical protein
MLAFLYSFLAVIALALIGLDILISYISTGRPPY